MKIKPLLKKSYFFISLILFLLLSCYPPVPYQNNPFPQNNQTSYQTSPSTYQPQPANQQPVNQQQIYRPALNEDYYDARRDNDRNRPERDRRLSNAKRGSACEDESRSHECYELCQEMYLSRDREDCRELDTDSVYDIYEVYESIQNPRDLDSIDLDHFEWFLDVSLSGLDLIFRDDYNRSDSEDFLIWIAENEDVAEIIRDEDYDFRRLELLLSELINFDSDDVERAFTREVGNRDSILEYALETGNNVALNYFLEFFLDTDTACKNHSHNSPSKSCLIDICTIGANLNSRLTDYILSSNVFEDFAEDFIEHSRNSNNATPKKYTDLDEKWSDDSEDPEVIGHSICTATFQNQF
ncbi:MAG: DUF3824 domain-containing protein [Bdellovibrionales bacterium]|nr:DUF3824 domain-containing protein [Bdellovibrionales bacterium]